MPERALPPVVVMLSDGQPTDDYKQSLANLQKLPWMKKAVKIAIAIGQDADQEILTEFTGNQELVLQANNATMLTKMIKWASTAVSSVSTGMTGESSATMDMAGTGEGETTSAMILDMDNLPTPEEDVDGSDVW